jgi:hypothetical protein
MKMAFYGGASRFPNGQTQGNKVRKTKRRDGVNAQKSPSIRLGSDLGKDGIDPMEHGLSGDFELGGKAGGFGGRGGPQGKLARLN